MTHAGNRSAIATAARCAWDRRAGEALKTREVHVIAAFLHERRGEAERFETHLSDRERERADRFAGEDGRADFVVGRGILRELLGEYTGEAPGSIRFDYGPNGKPFREAGRDGGPHFNLSHSHGVALYAFRRDAGVGVDVEYTGRTTDAVGIARRFFTTEEAEDVVLIGDETARRMRFFRVWTCKEACAKWAGEGIPAALEKYEIRVSGDEVRSGPAGQPALVTVDPVPGWVGALATDGPMPTVVRRRLG